MAFALTALLFIFFYLLLGWLTKHGQTTKVPDVYKKPVKDAIKILEAKGFRVAVQDTVYYDTLPLLSVVKQLPAANEIVKVNRTIFLTVNREKPPTVLVPSFKGLTYKMVEMQLRALNLKMGDTSYRPDFAKGSVLEQLYRGKKLLPGTSLPYGSKVDLILGGGLLKNEIPVPSLVGLTFQEAKWQLDTTGILLGAIVVNGRITDSASAIIYLQNPPVRNEDDIPLKIRQGQLMDLWISQDRTILDSIEKVKKEETLLKDE